MKKLSENELIVIDVNWVRIALPSMRNPRIRSSALWAILKDMVGKDITKISLPVILNEPLTNL